MTNPHAYRSRIGQQIRRAESFYFNPELELAVTERGAGLLKKSMSAPSNVRTESMKIDDVPVVEDESLDKSYQVRVCSHDGVSGKGMREVIRKIDVYDTCIVTEKVFEDMFNYANMNYDLPKEYRNVSVHVSEYAEHPILTTTEHISHKRYI